MKSLNKSFFFLSFLVSSYLDSYFNSVFSSLLIYNTISPLSSSYSSGVKTWLFIPDFIKLKIEFSFYKLNVNIDLLA